LERFFENYVNCLHPLFVIGEKHATVERALEFAAKFSVSLYDDQTNNEDGVNEDKDMPPFLKKLFDYLNEVGQNNPVAVMVQDLC